MESNNTLSWVTSIFTTFLGATSVETVARIVLLILGIISGLFSLAFNIYCWYKKSNKDGKITPDEIKEGIDIINNGIDDIKNNTEDK